MPPTQVGRVPSALARPSLRGGVFGRPERPRMRAVAELSRSNRLDPHRASPHAAATEGGVMNKERLTAFSDGVIAIVITIMVLELKVPRGATLQDLASVLPVFVSYVLSFVFVAIYWNNHHHLLHAARRVNAGILWSNMHLLFWLSLLPFTTAWMGENHFSRWPVAVYGSSMLLPAIAYYILQTRIVAANGPDRALADALGRDLKGKLSPLLCVAGIGLAFVHPLLGFAAYVLLASMWLIPDRRIERAMAQD
jgi:uncharacterized membrane protein